jgi:hypothetical protein
MYIEFMFYKENISEMEGNTISFWMKMLLLTLMVLHEKRFQELSEIFTIMEFDFSKPIRACYGKAQVF